MLQVMLFSTISGLATVIGGLLALTIGKKADTRIVSLLLGLAAGVMMGVVLFDLLPNAQNYTSTLGVILGFGLGIIIMLILEAVVPHLHKSQHIQNANEYVKMGCFVALGIALHNLPEGLAIGAGYEAAPELGGTIAIAIALHNVPEGLGLSVPLRTGGMRGWLILLICFLAGIFTPLGTLIGAMFMNINMNCIGISLALAAGAMSYIVVDELIPEAYQQAKMISGIGILCGMAVTIFAH